MVAARYNRLILAVDLGTSGCKCALVGLDGVVHKWAFRPVPLHIVDQVGAEQAPEDWWSAFIGAARELFETMPEARGEIAAICCSCQGECTVPLTGQASRYTERCYGWTCAALRSFAAGPETKSFP